MNKNSKESKIYVDPFYFPNFPEYVEPLALLVDKIFIYDPTELLISGKYPQSRFNEFVDEKIFTPIFISNPEQYKLEISNYVMRKDIIEDYDFFPIYNLCIEADRRDRELLRIFDTFCSYSKEQIDDLIFSLNWDLIISQVLGAYCLTPSVLKPVWKHKFSLAFKEEEIKLMKDFLINYTLDFPKNLSIYQIKKLREDNVSKKLRTWFKEMYLKLENLKIESVEEINEVHLLLSEFREMLNNEKNKIKNYCNSLGVILSTVLGIVGIIVCPFISAISPLATLPVSKLIQKIWEKFGKNNWIFIIAELKKKEL